jgi:hypothetical protein
MNEVFEKEWKLYHDSGDESAVDCCCTSAWPRLYRKNGALTPFEAEHPKADGKFDPEPKPGEIRVFADMKRPFVALVAESRGAAGWLWVLALRPAPGLSMAVIPASIPPTDAMSEGMTTVLELLAILPNSSM